MAAVGDRDTVVYAKKLASGDFADDSDPTNGEIKAIAIPANRIFGAREGTGGGKSTSSETVTAVGPDSDPQPLGGETTLNDFSFSGYYDVKVTGGAPAVDAVADSLLAANHGDEWVFITLSRKSGWTADTWFGVVKYGVINATQEINMGNPYSFSIGAQQKGDVITGIYDIS